MSRKTKCVSMKVKTIAIAQTPIEPSNAHNGRGMRGAEAGDEPEQYQREECESGERRFASDLQVLLIVGHNNYPRLVRSD